ncbi:MAG: ribonuclease III [Bacillales bacterium]|nr:ribonuclease III [Mollicutes bacterium]MCI7213728.1 ribonuclease III [Bacillales bacterium]MDY3904202.1 ribonuclease III [Candidatus Enteromonas sp.]MCI7058152.1 ribonuclease III [Mollicutes bacterium]MDD7714293.1 ribonuclease III [Mollicutes bacterium]
MSSEFMPLYRRFMILPKNEELYRLAFTHSSYNGMAGTRHQDYERLEFLGDSIVGMIVSELCYLYHPEMEQGRLSILKAQFIRSSSEANYCKKLGLNEYIKVGPSFSKEAKNNVPLLEDVFESFIGALYLDQGCDFTLNFVRKIFDEDIKNATIDYTINPKSYLQEAMQADNKESVVYKIIEERGTPMEKVFVAAVYFEGNQIGKGEGHNKKAAETEAAKDALSRMSLPKQGL